MKNPPENPARFNIAQLRSLGQWFPHLAMSRFVRNVAVVASGTAAAQAITIAFSPIITRLYGPEAFGILGMFTAVVMVIAPIASLAYEHAIVLPASDSEARLVFRLAISIGAGVSAICVVVFGTFHQQIGKVLGFGIATSYLILVPLVVFFAACAQVLQQWLVRMKRFRSIARIEVAYSASLGVSKSAFGLIAATAPMLVVLSTIGYALRAALLWLAARRTLTDQRGPLSPAQRLTAKASLREVAFSFHDFPFYRAPQLLLASISQGIPTMLLAALFGPSASGFYALSVRVLMSPVLLISDSVGKVFLPRIAEAARRGEKPRSLMLKVTGGLALIGLLPFGVVIAFGPLLFGVVFGAEWVVAGQYARWLALWLYVWFVSVPCAQAIPVLGLQGQRFVFGVFTAILSIGALIIGAVVQTSDIGAVALYAITSALCGLGIIVWVIRRSNTCLREGIQSEDRGSQ